MDDKRLYAELQEAFEKLKKDEAERVYSAVENHEFPPIPFTLPVVLKTCHEVYKNHKITKEELAELLAAGQADLSKEEFDHIIDSYRSK